VATSYSYSIVSSTTDWSTAVSEGGAITFTITRSASGSASTVYLSTVNATTSTGDYQAVDKLAMNFAANETVKTIKVTTNVDGLTEGSEYFWLELFTSYADALTNNWSVFEYGLVKDPGTVGATPSYTTGNSVNVQLDQEPVGLVGLQLTGPESI
jgi:hypothetical protein